MNTFIRTFRSPVVTSGMRSFASSIKDWGIRDLEILHRDFEKIQKLKNDQFQLPFVVTEIPPPFCPRCRKFVKNKCLLSPIHDLSIEDLDLTENPKLITRCPVFGEVSTIFNNNNVDETSSKKDE